MPGGGLPTGRTECGLQAGSGQFFQLKKNDAFHLPLKLPMSLILVIRLIHPLIEALFIFSIS